LSPRTWNLMRTEEWWRRMKRITPTMVPSVNCCRAGDKPRWLTRTMVAIHGGVIVLVREGIRGRCASRGRRSCDDADKTSNGGQCCCHQPWWSATLVPAPVLLCTIRVEEGKWKFEKWGWRAWKDWSFNFFFITFM